jgi:alpha-beta hydrolase superfamily lysophospholipase
LRYYALDGVAARARHEVGTVEIGGERIVWQSFTPANARASAIVSHGFYDHTGLYRHLIDFLVGEGLKVLAFDQPGHGLSSGPRASIDDFDRYVEVLRTMTGRASDWPKPVHLFGQSMGGAVSMEYLLQHGRAPFAEVVLFAPLVRPLRWPFGRWAYRAARVLRLGDRPRSFSDNAENPDFLALVRADPLAAQTLPIAWVGAMSRWVERFDAHPPTRMRVRMLQGDDDHTVDGPWGIKRISDKFVADVFEIPGAGHHLVNESPARRELMWEWLRGRCNWER